MTGLTGAGRPLPDCPWQGIDRATADIEAGTGSLADLLPSAMEAIASIGTHMCGYCAPIDHVRPDEEPAVCWLMDVRRHGLDAANQLHSREQTAQRDE